MPGWQAIYTELKDQGLEIVAVAQDTGGEAAAGKFYDRAEATYTTLIDKAHVVSSLYHLVNVPMGVWIDEQGQIVRGPEVAYTSDVSLLSIKVPGSQYVAALRDWVKNGAESEFALQPEELPSQLISRTSGQAVADAHFKLAAYLEEQSESELADKHWQEAQKLHPDSWNYHRQDWSFNPQTALRNWLTKFRALGDQPYYAPLELPTADN